MLAGDFNTVFDRSLDRRGSDPFDVSRESSCALNRLLNACSSIDIWRYLHPTSSSYTWTRSNGSLSSRIDFILVPHVWVPSVSSCDIVACPFSDHCAVVMSVRVPVFPLWLSGGTRGKVSSRDSLLDIAVFVLLSGHNTVASCLGWQTPPKMSGRCWFYILFGALPLHSCRDCPNRHCGCPWGSGSCSRSLGGRR